MSALPNDDSSIATAGADPGRRKAAANEAPGNACVHAPPPYLSADYLRAALRTEAARLRLVLAEIELAEIGVREGWMPAQNAFDLFERSGAIEFLAVAS